MAADAAIDSVPAENPLGTACGSNHTDNGFDGACGSQSSICIIGIGEQRDPEGMNGYCTPSCMNDTAICTTGYSGPGTPQCVLSLMQGAPPNACVIICGNDDANCPDGLKCVQVMGQSGTVGICGGMEWEENPPTGDAGVGDGGTGGSAYFLTK